MEELRTSVLVRSAMVMAGLATVWVVTYAALGLWESAAIPFAYQLASAASVYGFLRTRRFVLFRRSQLAMSLVFPFLLQWSLGGFENGSAVCLWGVTSPLGALMFAGVRQSVPWFAGFAGLVAVSAIIDPTISQNPPDVPDGVIVTFFALNLIGVSGTAYGLLQYFVRAREREQERSERLLLNVLPEPVAERLKETDGIIADHHDEATVLFADLVGFTELAERMPADELVSMLDRIFARWDELASSFGVEKIKTIGDAYMAASGIPSHRADHVEAAAEMSLAMGPAAASSVEGLPVEVRIGIDTGPVVAGVIGRSKFIYDLWGDTVNTASRMESHAPPGAIQITERVHDRLPHGYRTEPRGPIEIKGKGVMPSYILLAGPA